MIRTLGIPALILSLAIVAGCSKEAVKEAEPVAPVEVTKVQRDSIQRIINAEGVLRALDQSAIIPKISAPVRRFLVNRGDHVRKGQVLAELANIQRNGRPGFMDRVITLYLQTAAELIADLEAASAANGAAKTRLV